MRVKYKLYFVILGLVARFLFFGSLSPALLQANDARSKVKIVSPASLLEKDRMTLITIFSVVVDEEMVGVLAVYDDDTTERPTDYVEIYDNTGHLPAVGWFDQFGIERVAVDRGLLEPNQIDSKESLF
jgi:hypothetical protein